MVVEVCPVKKSIQEIDDSWVIGNRILLSRRRSSSSDSRWSDGTGSFYVISDAPYPLPPSRPLPTASNIQMIYDAGGVSAVWSIGDAFCKVKILDPGATQEHVTLEYLHDKRPLSFATPDVHYHAEYDGRYYIILSRLAGQTLSEAWPNIDEAIKQHYVSRVANICKELAIWQADGISGVDGQHLSDHFLTRLGLPNDCSPRNLLNNCEELGMDCSTCCFYHCDLGPGNIIVNPAEGSIGIIDWETAGFVPKEWIRTKFCVSSGMDLPGIDQDSRVDWRRRVQRQLAKEGFPEITKQ
ncbi:kinase-like domain-containing protein [Biscogniauxia marginata]|nr:kinase-like domain-containing protein [Biscogniauxia marginata]